MSELFSDNDSLSLTGKGWNQLSARSASTSATAKSRDSRAEYHLSRIKAKHRDTVSHVPPVHRKGSSHRLQRGSLQTANIETEGSARGSKPPSNHNIYEVHARLDFPTLDLGSSRSGDPGSPIDTAKAQSYILSMNNAASKIQSWYKKNLALRQQREIREIMAIKRKEKLAEMTNVKGVSTSSRNKIEERRRQERMVAIRDLHKKRADNLKLSANNSHSSENSTFRKGEKRFVDKNSHRKMTHFVDEKSPDSNMSRSSSKSVLSSDRILRDESDYSGEYIDSMKNTEAASEMSPKREHSHQSTTLDSLLETLKQLEDPADFPELQKNELKAKSVGWIDDFEETLEKKRIEDEELDHWFTSKVSENIMFPAMEIVPKAVVVENHSAVDGVKVDEANKKLKDIMHFLDDLDREETARSSTRNSAGDTDALSITTSEVTTSVMKLKGELDEKKQTVHMLQKALNQQRELTVKHVKDHDAESKRRFKLQQDEYESTISRHLSFIDQLIDDKKALSGRCEQVVNELKQIDSRYTTKIKQMGESHSSDVQRLKEVHAAAEKLRREKWIDEKTKKIKEITVKGLEPEIQKMIAQHKQEIKKFKSIHEAELLHAEESAGQKYIKQVEDLRNRFDGEKEDACARERDLAKQRYEKQLEQDEMSFQQQRRRLFAEIQEEKSRLADLGTRQRLEVDRQHKQAEEANQKLLDQMRNEYEKQREDLIKKHQYEVSELETRLKIEKLSWEENYRKQQENMLSQKERQLKEKVKGDRDKEIEGVISRLEDEFFQQKEECERTADVRIKRIRDKYEAELKEMELSERSTLERQNEIKTRLMDSEGDVARLKSLLNTKDIEIGEIKKTTDKLTEERDRLADVIRMEFAERLVTTDDENRSMKTELSELKAKHKLELSRIVSEKQDEMDEVHKRVKQAILKKEEVVTNIRQQYNSAVKRADHLEALLEQQRKQLLKK